LRPQEWTNGHGKRLQLIVEAIIFDERLAPQQRRMHSAGIMHARDRGKAFLGHVGLALGIAQDE
jgi:hypothetical protein